MTSVSRLVEIEITANANITNVSVVQITALAGGTPTHDQQRAATTLTIDDT